jgi:hypothetical protein
MKGSTRRRSLRSATGELLGQLGPTTADVAASLESAGVRGVPRSGNSCVIARYLNAVMAADPEVRSIMVSSEGVTVSVKRWWAADVLVPAPKAVRQFIRHFDSGDYANLVAERTEASPQPSYGSS